MTAPKIIEAVNELNAEIYEQTQFEYIRFEFSTDGVTGVIKFLGECLWNEDDDMREWDDEGEIQEPLLDYLKREAKDLIAKINELSL